MSIPDKAIFEMTLRGEAESLAPILAHIRTIYTVLRERGPSLVEPGSTRQRWHFVLTVKPGKDKS